MSLNKPLLIVLLSCMHAVAVGQGFMVSGTVSDDANRVALIGVTVVVSPVSDSTRVLGAVTDETGKFQIEGVPQGSYRLKASYIGYTDFVKRITITNKNVDAGKLKMHQSSVILKAAVITAKQTRVEQIGDTIMFHADAYKVNPDANAEDLVTKMPGVTSDGSTVKVNGENVTQVYVDGKPFFGDDPTLALKNLPAEIIDKIQVFDKPSEQAQFTGFDDGQSNKTINIMTKAGKNNGQFGKIYAGYGEDGLYNAGGGINFFSGDQRLSIIGLSNNVNQQNFATQDLLGVLGSSGGGGGRGGGGGSRGGGTPGGGNYGQGGNSANNFLVGVQPGVATTNSLGMNYSDNWGKKIKVTGSYFFNSIDNKNSTTSVTDYVTPQQSGLVYDQYNLTENRNYNNRFNMRLEYTVDSSNSFVITPKVSQQENKATSFLAGTNLDAENSLLSMTSDSTNNYNSGYDFSNSILFRHKFAKKGRTFSVNIGTDVNSKTGNGNIYANNIYYDTTTVMTLTDEQSTQNTNGYTVSTSLNYTEPVGEKGQLQLNYSPSYLKNNTDKETDSLKLGDFTSLDSALSNKFNDVYISNKAGIGYRINTGKLNMMAGVNYQYSTLSGEEIFPTAFTVQRTFNDVLPQAMLNIKFLQVENLRIMYRTSTNVPSISQLQNVINNSNTLLLTTGNPGLLQDYEHTITVRFGTTNKAKGKGLFIYLYGNYALNYIGNSSFIAIRDTTLSDGVLLNKGSQITMPVNLQNYWNVKSFITDAIPIEKIKCNLNLNGGYNFTQTPGLINNEINLSDNQVYSGGVVLSSNISQNVDFSVSTTPSYSIVKNSLQTQLNSNYYYQTAGLKLNLIFLKGVVFNTTMNYTLYTGLSQSYNQHYTLWNAYLGYKFLKNRGLEVKASVFDILNQNNSITRTVTDTYIEDSQAKVLNRYLMLAATYTLRNFKK